MADQWANKFEQLGITDEESILNERWANLGLDPFLLNSIDDREDEPLKKIEVVFWKKEDLLFLTVSYDFLFFAK